MAEATLTPTGDLTVPEPIREHLHLRPGDRVDFLIRDNGEVVVRPAGEDVRKLKGFLPRPEKPVSIDKMNRAIRKRARETA